MGFGAVLKSFLDYRLGAQKVEVEAGQVTVNEKSVDLKEQEVLIEGYRKFTDGMQQRIDQLHRDVAVAWNAAEHARQEATAQVVALRAEHQECLEDIQELKRGAVERERAIEALQARLYQLEHGRGPA